MATKVAVEPRVDWFTAAATDNMAVHHCDRPSVPFPAGRWRSRSARAWRSPCRCPRSGGGPSAFSAWRVFAALLHRRPAGRRAMLGAAAGLGQYAIGLWWVTGFNAGRLRGAVGAGDGVHAPRPGARRRRGGGRGPVGLPAALMVSDWVRGRYPLRGFAPRRDRARAGGRAAGPRGPVGRPAARHRGDRCGRGGPRHPRHGGRGGGPSPEAGVRGVGRAAWRRPVADRPRCPAARCQVVTSSPD